MTVDEPAIAQSSAAAITGHLFSVTADPVRGCVGTCECDESSGHVLKTKDAWNWYRHTHLGLDRQERGRRRTKGPGDDQLRWDMPDR